MTDWSTPPPSPELWADLSHQLLVRCQAPRDETHTLGAFAKPGSCRIFDLPMSVPARASIAHRFSIRPLLPLFREADVFHVLALGERKARLFAANRYELTETHSEEVPRDLAVELRGSEVEQLQFHAAAVGMERPGMPSYGSGEHPKRRLHDYLSRLKMLVHAKLTGQHGFIVLAATEYLGSLYREIDRDSRLLERHVAADPDSLSAQELRAKASEIVEPYFAAARERELVRYRDLAGTGFTSDSGIDILTNAAHGRVATLFLRAGVEAFDASGEDLMNQAALATLQDRGLVYELAPSDMPTDTQMAARFRY